MSRKAFKPKAWVSFVAANVLESEAAIDLFGEEDATSVRVVGRLVKLQDGKWRVDYNVGGTLCEALVPQAFLRLEDTGKLGDVLREDGSPWRSGEEQN